MAGGGAPGAPKKVAAPGCTLVCVDESGFHLLPACVRSWAPCGKPAVLRTPLRRRHLSVIGGVTASGRLFQHVVDHPVRAADCVRFLGHLLRHVEGRLVVVWDNLPAHRGHRMRTFLSGGASRRMELVALPGYAPELNPQEGVWKHLKRVELGNVCCRTMEELRGELRAAVQRLRQKPRVIAGCFRHAGYV